MTEAVRLVIRGRVQGVGFRYWALQEARRRTLQGWVRNRRDGSVEALFLGPAEAVRAMVQACRQGPQGSRVDTVEEHAADPAEAGQGGFAQRDTS